MAALVRKLWVLQQCAIFQSMSLFGCMKLQLTSAKIINNLADSDCKYYYLKDSLPCKCALNGAYKMGGPGSASIPNFAWVSWEAHYCTSWELKRIPLSEHTQTACPSYTTHIKVSCFNKAFVIHSRRGVMHKFLHFTPPKVTLVSVAFCILVAKKEKKKKKETDVIKPLMERQSLHS